jgi:predicted alpha/beta hydrolase family esterase
MTTLSPRMNPIDSIIIIHSEDDKILSFRDAERTAQAMKGSELIKLKNWGHYKILWSDDLKEIIVDRVHKYSNINR